MKSKTKSKKKKPVLSRKNAQSSSTLQGKNAQSISDDANDIKNVKKMFNAMFLNKHTAQPLFYIYLKEKEEGFPKGMYPVYQIENEKIKVGARKSPLEIMLGKKIEGMSKEEKKEVLKNAELTLDEDDEEYMEDIQKEVEPVFQIVVWLFIANAKNGQYAWVDSSNTYYLG